MALLVHNLNESLAENDDIIISINRWINFACDNQYHIILSSCCADLVKLDKSYKKVVETKDIFCDDNLKLFEQNKIKHFIVTGLHLDKDIINICQKLSELGYEILVPRNSCIATTQDLFDEYMENIFRTCKQLRVIKNFLPLSLRENAKERICDEVNFKKMFHEGGEVSRKVETQGISKFIDGKEYKPLYRFPTDEEFIVNDLTPFHKKIWEYINNLFGPDINHSKLQYYENGYSHIGRHSDKTLDIKKHSYILNLSLGNVRNFVFTEKSTRKKTDYMLEDNTLFILNTYENKMYTHEVPKYNELYGDRISIVYRSIATYKCCDEDKLIGQGAGECSDVNKLKECFVLENNQGENFVWDENYGKGFSVVNTGNKHKKS